MAVNIYNPEDIHAYLASFVQGGEVETWINAALYKPLLKREESAVLLTELPDAAPEWLQNKWDICGPFHKFEPDAALDDQVRHIADWLLVAKMHNVPVTIRQLQNLATLDNLTAAADRFVDEMNFESAPVTEDDNDTKTVMSFDDGSRIVQLLTPNALRYEGPSMGHCIGGGSYDEKLLNGSCVFYSLRDKDNNPHATFHVEVEGNILRQCKGKKNEPPVQKYMPYVQQFVTENKFKLEEGPRHTGLIQDDAGQYHSIFNLPENLTIRGGLALDDCIGLTQLPENLTIGGTLWLNGCTGLTQLPENLSVGGGLWLNGCTGLTRLPENLSVKGIFALNGCTGLMHLPEGLSIGGDLSLSGCTALTPLPENLSVGGDLYLKGCTGLTQLSENLSVRGDLDLKGCTALTTLPENLSVGGDLYLWGCTRLTQLPENLTVGGELYLNRCTGLTSIPRTMKCSGKIYTDLGSFNTIADAADAFDKKFDKPAKICKSSLALKTA